MKQQTSEGKKVVHENQINNSALLKYKGEREGEEDRTNEASTLEMDRPSRRSDRQKRRKKYFSVGKKKSSWNLFSGLRSLGVMMLVRR